MKQRLMFLGRRHTDASISSVRPTPEEAKKWAESFPLLMSHKCKLQSPKAEMLIGKKDEDVADICGTSARDHSDTARDAVLRGLCQHHHPSRSTSVPAGSHLMKQPHSISSFLWLRLRLL